METNPSTRQQSFDMESDHFEPTEAEAPPRYAFKIIRLNPGISPLNFTCCLINIVTGVFGFMTVSMLEPFALLDKDYFNIDQGHVGTITSLALSVDLIIKMLFLIPYGHCSDRFGRKVVIYYGAASYFLACVILSSQKTIPGFILAKIFLANAGAAISSVPLIADYTADESRGRAAGLMVALVALTSMFGNLFMKLLLYRNIALDKCYIIAGVLVVCILILNTFGLKNGRYHAPTPPDAPKQNTSSHEASILQNLKETVQIFRENGWIKIGFILQMAGNSTSAIFFNYMSLYIKSLFSSDIDSNTANIAVNNIQTFTFIPPLICTIAYGHFLNKGNNPIKMSFLVLCGSMAAFLLIISSNDPSDSALVLAAMCTGAFLPGILVLSSFINIKNYPSDKRAIMGGFMGLFSNICNFLISSSAGLLYDNWLRKGPFIFEFGLLIVGILLICAISKRKGLGNYTALKDSKQLDLERLIAK